MDISDLTVRILLLFLPGIICHFIVDALTVHRERAAYQVFLLAYVYGMISYVLYAMIAVFCRGVLGLTTLSVPLRSVLANSFTSAAADVDVLEVVLVTALSVPLGFAMSFGLNRYFLHRLARRLHISKKFGELDVWSHVHNSPDVHWVTVRDLANNFMFQGYIAAFSDAEEVRELVLTDAIVYNERTGVELYRANRIYLSRTRDGLVVELLKSSTQRMGNAE